MPHFLTHTVFILVTHPSHQLFKQAIYMNMGLLIPLQDNTLRRLMGELRINTTISLIKSVVGASGRNLYVLKHKLTLSPFEPADGWTKRSDPPSQMASLLY
ncbi:hypothetical protein CEXT_734691 [Caerostris extrusa]|uniref:Uncharacterized protein n=1 Tax=Caerostris extrusa TaxID=172846 RepID=A0AAV4N6A2_CAEEX|nr:hypothetical protein CEXT_734691 [Caerostris extrusa]